MLMTLESDLFPEFIYSTDFLYLDEPQAPPTQKKKKKRQKKPPDL